MNGLATDKPKQNTAPENRPDKRVILPAEKKFNSRLYWGLNYGIQVSTAVAGSYWIKYGGGKKYFDKAAEWAGEKIIPKITNKRGAKAVEETNTYLIGGTQLMIGNLFFLPIKWFENRKPQYVRKIDEAMLAQQENDGLPVTAEQRQHHEAALQALEKEPKASWPTLIVARAAGIGSFFVSNWIIGEKRSSWLQNKAADGVQGVLKNSGMKPLEKLGSSPKTRNFTKLAFIDFFYSIAVANTVFQVTKILTRNQKRSHVDTETENKEEALQATTQIDNKQVEPHAKSFADKHSHGKEQISPRKKFTDYAAQSAEEAQVAL